MATITSTRLPSNAADTIGDGAPQLTAVSENWQDAWKTHLQQLPQRFAHHGLLSGSTPAATGEHFVAHVSVEITGILSVNNDVVAVDATDATTAQELLSHFGPASFLGQVPLELKSAVEQLYHSTVCARSEWWVRSFATPLPPATHETRPLGPDDAELIAGRLDPRYEPGWRTMLKSQPCEGLFFDEELVALAAAPYIGGGVAEVGWVRTIEPFRRRGFGRAVAASLLHRLSGLGITHAVLLVAANNTSAQGMYGDLGFSKQETLVRLSGWRRQNSQ